MKIYQTTMVFKGADVRVELREVLQRRLEDLTGSMENVRCEDTKRIMFVSMARTKRLLESLEESDYRLVEVT